MSTDGIHEFTKDDWNAYAGATGWMEGSPCVVKPPYISSIDRAVGVREIIIVAREAIEIQTYYENNWKIYAINEPCKIPSSQIGLMIIKQLTRELSIAYYIKRFEVIKSFGFELIHEEGFDSSAFEGKAK